MFLVLDVKVHEGRFFHLSQALQVIMYYVHLANMVLKLAMSIPAPKRICVYIMHLGYNSVVYLPV